MKYTVITKDGSKWLKIEPPSSVYRIVFDTRHTPEYPYLGSSEPGTSLSEEQVSVIYQVSVNGVWAETTYENYAEDDELGFPVRTVYTDAEPECPECGKYCSCPEEDIYDAVADYRRNHPEPSHDHQISDDARYPLFSHMSSEHGLTLLDSELDEIARHAAPLTGVEYWKERCKVAEQMIGICPSDPKTYDEFCRLYDEWEQLIEQNQWPR